MERFGMVAALVTVAGFGSTGCMVSAEPGELSVSTSYYSPMHYNGHVVYYDTVGLPIYYVGGSAVYVPSTHSSYGAYRTHYTSHRGNYNRWYGSRGRQLRTRSAARSTRRAKPARRARPARSVKPARRGHPQKHGGKSHRR